MRVRGIDIVEKFVVKGDEERRVLTRGSLELFARYYFGHILTDDVPDFHIELYDLFKPGMGTQRVLRALDIEPRAHGKSKRWSVIYPLWVILTDPDNIGFDNIDFMLISATASRAEDFLMEIGSEINGNPLLKADWGNQLGKAKRDNSSDKILNNGARIRAKGAGAQVRGDHPTYLVVDDLEDAEEAQNKDLRVKLAKWFNEDLYGTLLESSSMFLVGTIVHSESLLAELFKNDTPMTDGWVKRRYAAIKDDGTALWPTKWSIERLEKRRAEIGELAFSQEYLNQPLTSENPTVRPEWIQYYTVPPIKPREMYVVTAIDTASGEKKVNDYTAIATIGVVPHGDRKGEVYVLSVERGHWSLDEKKRKFFNHLERYGSDRGIVEINFDPSFMRILTDEARRRRVFNTILVPVKAKPKEDKLVRLESVSPMFQNGRLWFLREQRDAITEILLMPNGSNDDMADAIVWALRDLKNGYMRRLQTDRRGIDNSVVDAWYGG